MILHSQDIYLQKGLCVFEKKRITLVYDLLKKQYSSLIYT